MTRQFVILSVQGEREVMELAEDSPRTKVRPASIPEARSPGKIGRGLVGLQWSGVLVRHDVVLMRTASMESCSAGTLGEARIMSW